MTYKYNRKKPGKYQGTITVVLTAITVLALFGIIYIIINSMMNTGKNRFTSESPTPTATVTATATPTSTPEDTMEPTQPPPEETPTDTPTPTPDPGEIQIHVVVKGDTMSSIARKYYGSTDYSAKLCEYNGIENPDRIILSQKIKIPPLHVLQD